MLWPALAWGAALALRAPADCRDADFLAVLAGAQTYPERTAAAAALFDDGRAPVIVLTDDGMRGGWSQEERRNPFFVERAAAELRRYGVPADRIEVLAPFTSGTADEARRLLAFAEQREAASLLVVTSDYHGRRARMAFDRLARGTGITVRMCAVARRWTAAHPATWWLSRAGWAEVGSELPKLVGYAIRLP